MSSLRTYELTMYTLPLSVLRCTEFNGTNIHQFCVLAPLISHCLGLSGQYLTTPETVRKGANLQLKVMVTWAGDMQGPHGRERGLSSWGGAARSWKWSQQAPSTPRCGLREHSKLSQWGPWWGVASAQIHFYTLFGLEMHHWWRQFLRKIFRLHFN